MDIPSPQDHQHHHNHQQPPLTTTTPPPLPPPPPTTTTSPTTTNPDPDPQIQPTIPKQLPGPPLFNNGVLKRHKPRNHLNLPPPVVVTYKECLKNHAASMGGHAVDGCGEFIPSPTSTPTDPTSLKCGACGCHRNFHRRDPDELFHNIPYPPPHVIEYQPHHRHHPPPPQQPPPPQPISVAGARGNSLSPADSPSPPPISSSYYPSAPHMLLALSSAPPENTHTHTHNALISGVIGSNSNGKKRFRTKFSQDQKQKMHELAERVGWKMQKKDEDLIIGYCNEIGVEKGVFKVWMHNNKMTVGNKKDSGNTNGSSEAGGGIDFLTNHHQQLHINDSVSSGGGGRGGGAGGNGVGTNGSSSSS